MRSIVSRNDGAANRGAFRVSHLRPANDTYALTRQRMIRETEAALLLGMTETKLFPRIPVHVVGNAQFQKDASDAFWSQALGLSGHSRSFLRRAAAFLGNPFGVCGDQPADHTEIRM